METIKLLGRIFITCEIETITGLHIGNSEGQLEIGGVDNPILRNALTNEPYIPGSSLRGKMRSQLEKKIGAKRNLNVGNASIHACQDDDLNNPCEVCRIFGISANQKGFPTRLIVRDTALTKESIEKLGKAQTEQPFTEIKFENAIDRVTSVANPRNIERVPSGVVFGPTELVFSLYEESDTDLFGTLLDCMQLVEDDYLGGGGSRGNGQIKFRNISVSVRSNTDYTNEKVLGEYDTLFEFESDLENLKERINSEIEKG